MATLVNSSQEVLPAPKQIRFVNNQGQPPTKRRRINAACLTCRKRKTRCAGEHPTCSTCTKNGHACLGYSDGPGTDKKKDSSSAGGQSSAGDPTQVDPDDDDYMDEDADPDRRQQPPLPKEVEKQQQQLQQPPKHQKSLQTESKQKQLHRIQQSFEQAVEDDSSEPTTPAMQLKSETMEWEEHQSQATPRPEPLVQRPSNPRNHSFSTEDGRSTPSRSPTQYHSESHRVPYFRYFGPTAIVPGFKQMVVKVRDRRHNSISATSPSTGSVYGGLLTATNPDHELGHIEDMPIYDPNDTNAVHPLILNLVETFFIRLGSNYPFLHRNKFPNLVKEKRVEPILVDAVCALAARFSDVPVFKKWNDGKLARSEYGRFYAQRAKAATVDTFACPSVAAVQACLLMAYNGFGADQDSALWMYLGVAIRMAVDLGLTKEDGIKYRGAKDPWYTRWYDRQPADEFFDPSQENSDEDALSPKEQKEVEQERIDTFWAVFFLDRAISSGTGRPVTLKDDDFDLELPSTSIDSASGWPDPKASLLRIIHLYGRVSDVLNVIKHPQDLTREKLNQLVQMENELTKLHQLMEPRLRFDANNFQAHVKNGQGTTFILLHFWFHALIIVLHQPTLLTRQGTIDRKHQLKPHSRELSMSSAKTITDILAFAELLDPKCFIGNPFTSQPIYIAACAFLMESKTTASQPTPRDSSPPGARSSGSRTGVATTDSNASSKHLLLASAANQNYQVCYKALKQMHTYWGGVRYILTVLDHKAQGKWDCETYTSEEYESTKRSRRNSTVQRYTNGLEYPASPIPDNPLAWSLTGTTNSPNSSLTLLFQNPVSGGAPHYHGHHHHPHQRPPHNQQQQQQQHQQTVQSSQSSATPTIPVSAPTPPGNMIYDPIRQSLPETTTMFPPAYPQPNTSALRHSVNRHRRVSSSSVQGKPHMPYDSLPSDDVIKSSSSPDNKMPISIPAQTSATIAPTSYTPSSQHSSGYDQSGYPTGTSPTSTQSHTFVSTNHSTPGGAATYSSDGGPSNFAQSGSGLASSGYSYLGPTGSNLHLLTYDNETDIGQHLTSFEHAEMMSWFGDYFPNDVLGLYPGDSHM
ncbi:fungal-specific transcription factor domain-containing protein [Biscogniauxia mediterranea]|nr:fungal-specific transcription factor domain-containing protein [Biscogniauxia mediterranea]